MSWRTSKDANISDLIGKVLSDVEFTYSKITFKTECGDTYLMYHERDCCETVEVEDVCGDMRDIIGSPILVAEESESGLKTGSYESETWTFYKIDTAQGGVTIRWYGTSNGYYSERVDFRKLNGEVE